MSAPQASRGGHAAAIRRLSAAVRVEGLGRAGGGATAPAGTRTPALHTLARLAEAETHYADRGYRPVAAPWIVSPAATNATSPPNGVQHRIAIDGGGASGDAGHLVASGEQSFLQLLIDATAAGDDPAEVLGRAQCTTACFRYERDELHQRHFLKLELIDTTDTTASSLAEMVEAAAEFHTRHLEIEVIAAGAGLDIVCANTGIELGSYGIRTATIDGRTHRWVYGTGCAEPRLTQTVAANT